MPRIGLGIGLGKRSGPSWSQYWAKLISATVEDAAPTDVVLTFPTAKPALVATDFTCTVNGVERTISSASWTGAVLTLVLSSTCFYGDVVIVTFVKSGGTANVTNNIEMEAEYLTVYNSFTTKPGATITASQNTMVRELKAAGVWTKRDVYYFFSNHTNNNGEALKNWRNPGTYDATLAFGSGGANPAYTQYLGFQGHIVNKSYIRSNYNPFSNGTAFLEQNHGVAIGLSANTSTADVKDYGFYADDVQSKGVTLDIAVGGTSGGAYDFGSYKLILRSGFAGHWYQNRNNNTLDLYKSGAKTSHTEATSQVLASGEIYILARNRVGIGANGYSDNNCRWFGAGGYLTMTEVLAEVQAVEKYLYSIGANIHPYAPENDLEFEVTGAVTVRFEMAVFQNSPLVIIDWGDGTNKLVNYGDADPLQTKTYSVNETRTIKISHANSIRLLTFGRETAKSNLHGDIARLNVCGALETLGIYTFEDQWTGTISGLAKTITNLYLINSLVNEDNVITGDISLFTALEYVFLSGNITGTLSNANDIVKIELTTNPGLEITFDLSNKLSFEAIDSYADNSFAGGDVGTAPKLKHICHGSPNGYYGDISLCPDFEYLDNYGGSYIHGDISALNKIYRFKSYNCNNAFTGSIDGLTELGEFSVMNDSSNITKPTRLNALTKLGYLTHDNWQFTSADITAMAADVYANRNIAKNSPNNERYLNFASNESATPTGQGATDIAALRLYRSPNNNAAYSLWTIATN